MGTGARVIVAGAGALGLSCALALADAGCAVTVCDSAPAGPSASGVAAGMLAPVFETVLDADGAGDFGLLMAARDLWPGFAARAGIALDRSGAVAVGSQAWLAGIAEAAAALGAPLEEVATAGLIPALTPAFSQGLKTAEDWRLEARPALAALRAAARAMGVDFRAEAVAGRGGADWLVVATGAGRGLARAAPELAALTPIKGQILRFRDMCGAGPSLRGEGAYAVPASDGLAVGATMEVGVADSRVDPAALRPLIDAAQRLFPTLNGAASAAFAGVRAATPDGLPMVGASRADPRVILAVGARRNGWLLAPMVAGMVEALVTGAEAGGFAGRFEPGRFDE